MDKIKALSDSKLLTLALVLMGLTLGLSLVSAGSADPWLPWPWV